MSLLQFSQRLQTKPGSYNRIAQPNNLGEIEVFKFEYLHICHSKPLAFRWASLRQKTEDSHMIPGETNNFGGNLPEQ